MYIELKIGWKVLGIFRILENPTEWTHKIKCKCGHDNKKCGTCGSKYMNIEWTNIKNDSIIYKCLCCYGNYQNKSLMKI